MFCKQCGVKIPEDSVFCYKCGARVASSAPEKQRGAVKPPVGDSKGEIVFRGNGTLHKFGSLRIDREKVIVPYEAGDIGDRKTAKRKIIIGDTISGRELRWIEWTKQNGAKLLVCDRTIVNMVTWQELDSLRLIFGTIMKIDGKSYRIRSLTGSNGSEGQLGAGADNEWDKLLDTVGDEEDLLHWRNSFTWCQEAYCEVDSYRSVRGYATARGYGGRNSAIPNGSVGFRPVLEILNEDLL